MTVVWESAKLGDVCTVIPGFAFKSKDWQDDGIPVVKIKNIQENRTIDINKIDCVPEDLINPRLNKFILNDGDILIAMTGATAGKVGKLRTRQRMFLNQRVAKIEPTDANKHFIWAVVSSNEYRRIFFHLADGAAQPNMSGSQIENVEISIPPLPTQQKIASILSAYDKLIENNTRRIQILEEMAQRIYKEWFVDFKYPGYENDQMVDSELGMIPEGWEVKNLDYICNITMGQSPKSKFYNDNMEGLPFHQGVRDFGDRFPNDRIYCTVENRIAYTGDILFSVRAPVGRINIANKKIVIGRGLSAIKSKSGNQVFMLEQLKHRFNKVDIMGSGTIYNAITKADLAGVKMLNPKESIISKFEQIADPIFSELNNLTDKNNNLRQTRDLLLPKLISGKIDVSDLDIDTSILND